MPAFGLLHLRSAVPNQPDPIVCGLRNHYLTRGLCEHTKPSARGLGWKPSPRVQGFGVITQPKGKVMAPILTQFLTISCLKMILSVFKNEAKLKILLLLGHHFLPSNGLG